MKQPDILLVMSDQHAAWYMGHEGGMVDTPHLDRLAAQGVRFANHYTACPLCVPARMSMLSAGLPTSIGVTGNNQTLAETTPTFLFPMVEAGYETVLIGRMHFIGKDLRHGFTRRIGGDMTPTSWVPPYRQIQEERGDFLPCFSADGCLNVVGGGQNPVRRYDEMVFQKALDYLSQPHSKPQFILVGVFGPHFPYVGEPELYQKYKRCGWLPPSFGQTPDFVRDCSWLNSHQKEVDPDRARNAVAAYCAMIEELDGRIGAIRAAFNAYAKTTGRPAVFGYLSDHGDTVGARNMYGKQTFFEDSARVPLILAGDGIAQGKTVSVNTSLMDLGPTLCALAGTAFDGPGIQGVDLSPLLADSDSPSPFYTKRAVISQYIESRGGASPWMARTSGASSEPAQLSYGVMVRKERWKYFVYHGCEDQAVLFDLQADPRETVNCIALHPETVAELHRISQEIIDPAQAEQEHQQRCRMNRWLRCYEKAVGPAFDERWKDDPVAANKPLEVI